MAGAFLTFRAELCHDRIDFIDEPVDLGFDCPLNLHCTHTRAQLPAALNFLKPATVREGVKWLPAHEHHPAAGRPIPAEFLKKTSQLAAG